MDNEEREIRGIVPGFFVPFVPTDERRCLCRSNGDILLILKNRKLDSILSSEVNYILEFCWKFYIREFAKKLFSD